MACESTSDYWIQVYDLFADQIPVIVGNAPDIKAISHKKTDNRCRLDRHLPFDDRVLTVTTSRRARQEMAR
ncbi:MAG: hypothetical protein WBJ06_11235 [Candidatus Methanoculleus thermohydrogenotrophicum]|nr:hypothetical protein [Candidatus Methanoculleus thermohydrogenotrophicum]NLM82837.1 hypothetical protein [Candidatus Methanoculleus thermohydrogenotrophicum]HPZ38443.1 hypothetical protein [Candidatus Methanoculleus thermohydrogenotrophicum]